MSSVRTRVAQRVDFSIETTEPRVTPRPARERFRDALGEGAQAVVSGVEQAAGLLPGGSAVSLAVRGGASGGAGGEGAEAPGAAGGGGLGGDMQSALDAQASQSLQLLELQQQISMEQRQFSTVSNVMKARHDTAKQVINNVR